MYGKEKLGNFFYLCLDFGKVLTPFLQMSCFNLNE